MSISFAYPRPEYPRPDRQRGTREGIDWLNLNGPWQFRFDRHRRGTEANWFLPDELGADGKRRALLVFRVEDPVDNREQPVGKQWRWYTTVSGIWQTVFVEPRSASHIECFRVFTDIDAGTARFQIECPHVDGEGT